MRELDGRFRVVAQELVDFARYLDPRFVVTSSLRTTTEQAQLYERMQQQKAAGLPYYLTNPPGTSQHERGLAIDMVRFSINPRSDELLHQLGQAWRELGFVWGGDSDPIHFGAPKDW